MTRFAEAVLTLADFHRQEIAAISQCHCTAENRQSCPAYAEYNRIREDHDTYRALVRRQFSADDFRAIEIRAQSEAYAA